MHENNGLEISVQRTVHLKKSERITCGKGIRFFDVVRPHHWATVASAARLAPIWVRDAMQI